MQASRAGASSRSAGHGAAQLDQLEELHARARVVAEGAEHRARHRERVLLLDAAHRHAQMRRFHHDGDAERRDLVADRVGDLVGQPLLHLQAAAEDVDEPRNLAEADHLVARNVGDVALAEERQQVMLAQAVEVDVLDDHHLAIIDREQRVVEHLVDVGVVSAGQKLERLLDPLRRVEQPLAARDPRRAPPAAS